MTHAAKTDCTRRRFLATMAAAGVGAVAPTFIPAAAMGRDGAVPPSETIRLGGIGIRNRGFLRFCTFTSQALQRLKL